MSQYTQLKAPWSSWHNRLHKKLIGNKKLIPSGSCILLSVSGGQDSMVMVKLFSDLQRLHKWQLHIWHGDHGWHEKSNEIAKELKNWCQEQKLNFYCAHATKEETKTEQAARFWRYSELAKTASFISAKDNSLQCQHVLTGHTSSDRAETFIMNLARGSDLTGLTSLREERLLDSNVHLIRPLLGFSREETTQICKELKIPIWLDPSNENLKFNRNKIRQIILPILEELYQGSSVRIASLAQRLTHYQEDQKALTLLAIEAISLGKGLSRNKLMSLSMSARSTLLAKWLEGSNAPFISSNQLELLSHKIGSNKNPGQLKISKNLQIIWSKELVHLNYRSN